MWISIVENGYECLLFGLVYHDMPEVSAKAEPAYPRSLPGILMLWQCLRVVFGSLQTVS